MVTKTPAEVIQERADADQPNMGLANWPNDNVRKSDVKVSKNYLAEPELRELNRLTSIILDIFEDQFELGRISTMTDVQHELDGRLPGLGRVVLSDGGSAKKTEADAHAGREYERFKRARKISRHKEADEGIDELLKAGKRLPKGRT